MRGFEVPVLEGDDVGFIHALRDELAKELQPTEVTHLVQVDHWFGPRWLAFAGKVLGALGVWPRTLVIPPFRPTRILSERRFVRSQGNYLEVDVRAPLHIEQTSRDNLRRTVKSLGASTSMIWYSGDTRAAGRGCLMIYLHANGEGLATYVEIARRDGAWRVGRRSSWRDIENRRAS